MCKNEELDLQSNTTTSFTIANNYWGTADTNAIATAVYDGIDNAQLGIVNYTSKS